MYNKKDFTRILTEVTIDNMSFQVTWNPYERNSCILWYRDVIQHRTFNALVKFTNFDKRKVLDFIVRYTTSPDLQNEIENKKFVKKLDTLPLSIFDQIELASFANKEEAYRNLFSLDASIEKSELQARRRMMIKKFHPDVGGDHRAMTIINQAYEYLVDLSN